MGYFKCTTVVTMDMFSDLRTLLQYLTRWVSRHSLHHMYRSHIIRYISNRLIPCEENSIICTYIHELFNMHCMY